LDGVTPQTAFRNDLHVTAMSHNEWLAAAGEAHVVINY
jgi:hypothetical protein